MSAMAAGVFLSATASSPPETTAGCDPLMDGKSKNFAVSPTVNLPSLVMSVPTKSPSYSMAAFGLAPNTSASDWVKLSCVAPGATAPGVLRYAAQVLSAVTTDGSVHGI